MDRLRAKDRIIFCGRIADQPNFYVRRRILAFEIDKAERGVTQLGEMWPGVGAAGIEAVRNFPAAARGGMD